MAFDTIEQSDWTDRIRFDVYQAKLSAATGDFSYFNISGPQYTTDGPTVDYFAVFAAQDVDADTKKKLGEINEKSAEANEKAVNDLATNLENTKVPDNESDTAKQDDWVAAINAQNEKAKKYVNDQMDAAANEAIAVIKKLPKDAQNAASNTYQLGVKLVMAAFSYLVEKIKTLYNAIKDFIKKVWTVITGCVKAVKDFVVDTVDKIKKLFGFGYLALAQANGFDVDDLDASQAKKFLLNLVYSFRVPHDEVVASTNRIWDNYLTQYSEATSEQEPQNVSLSRKPRPEGDRDTDGKLMFVSWEAGGGVGSDGGRDLIESLISSEQKSLSESYVGALRYNIVDMGNHPRSTQQKPKRGTNRDIELQNRRLKAQY